MSRDYRKNRREFLCDVGRVLTLGLLAGGAAALITKAGTRRIETCVNNGVCRGCGELSDCGLPQALSAKRDGLNNGRG
jgi:hypothetical protein